MGSDTKKAQGNESESHGDSGPECSPESSGKTPLGAVGDLVVGSSCDDHADGATDDGDKGTNQEGNSSVDSLLCEEQDDEEHDGDENQTNQVLLLQELDGALEISQVVHRIFSDLTR